VLQLVNTPDIYEETKYQRRNLLLYHCLLESGLRKFNVSEQVSTFILPVDTKENLPLADIMNASRDSRMRF
jgi:hypothetical protein